MIARKPHSEALSNLRPGAEWTLSGTEYDGLVWHDKDWPMPTRKEFEAERDRIAAEIIAAIADEKTQAQLTKISTINQFVIDGKISAADVSALADIKV